MQPAVRNMLSDNPYSGVGVVIGELVYMRVAINLGDQSIKSKASALSLLIEPFRFKIHRSIHLATSVARRGRIKATKIGPSRGFLRRYSSMMRCAYVLSSSSGASRIATRATSLAR